MTIKKNVCLPANQLNLDYIDPTIRSEHSWSGTDASSALIRSNWVRSASEWVTQSKPTRLRVVHVKGTLPISG